MLNTITSQIDELLSFSIKKHAETIGCFGYMFNDVKSAELVLVPYSKLYYLIKYTEQGTIDINFDL